MPKTTLLRKQVTQVGSIQPHAGANAPEGYLVCDGSIVNIDDYPKLYAVIGTSWGYGNNDGLTFHLPDLRGKFLRGVDRDGDGVEDPSPLDPDRATRTTSGPGGNTGNNVGSIQDDKTRRPRSTAFSTSNPGSHTHEEQSYNGSTGYRRSDAYTGYNANVFHSTGSAGSHTHTITGGGDVETRPVNAAVVYVIKSV